MAPSPTKLEPGEQLGRWTLLAWMGEGTTSLVWKVAHASQVPGGREADDPAAHDHGVEAAPHPRKMPT